MRLWTERVCAGTFTSKSKYESKSTIGYYVSLNRTILAKIALYVTISGKTLCTGSPVFINAYVQ